MRIARCNPITGENCTTNYKEIFQFYSFRINNPRIAESCGCEGSTAIATLQSAIEKNLSWDRIKNCSQEFARTLHRTEPAVQDAGLWMGVPGNTKERSHTEPAMGRVLEYYEQCCKIASCPTNPPNPTSIVRTLDTRQRSLCTFGAQARWDHVSGLSWSNCIADGRRHQRIYGCLLFIAMLQLSDIPTQRPLGI